MLPPFLLLLWFDFLHHWPVGLGLLFAILADQVKLESLAKSVFHAHGLSFVGGVVWKFM